MNLISPRLIAAGVFVPFATRRAGLAHYIYFSRETAAAAARDPAFGRQAHVPVLGRAERPRPRGLPHRRRNLQPAALERLQPWRSG